VQPNWYLANPANYSLEIVKPTCKILQRRFPSQPLSQETGKPLQVAIGLFYFRRNYARDYRKRITGGQYYQYLLPDRIAIYYFSKLSI
jgi:hypothetical protein